MSMHKKPLSALERAGLEAHGLDIGIPSQLSDVFRQGIAFALDAQPPALGGEPIKRFTTDVYFNGGNTYVKEVEFAHGHLVKYQHHADYVARLQAELNAQADRLADQKACANLAIANLNESREDWDKEREQLQAEVERYQTSAACALTSAENIQAELNQAQARTAALEGLLRDLRVRDDMPRVYLNWIDAALAEGAKCCEPTDEDLAALQAGDCTPEELWGGPRPTCRKCIGRAEGAKS